MCTAITYKTADHYFGRTLDLECSYGEMVTVTPRRFVFSFRHTKRISNHYAIIGMATIKDNYPLYYEAANEYGLAMAALNFPQNAQYFPLTDSKDNIAPFEFIPWILSQSRNLTQVRKLLVNLNLCDTPFSDKLPLSPLHWMITDQKEAITVECTAQGLHIYENHIGVLTNNPSFDYHCTHLCDYLNLSAHSPQNQFGHLHLSKYSRGMGAIGLPGDFSSASRFVRAAFVKEFSISGTSENESVCQFFHILDTVQQPCGCVRLNDDRNVVSVYTSCINANKGIYYYKTYSNPHISAIDMHRCDLDQTKLYTYQLINNCHIHQQN